MNYSTKMYLVIIISIFVLTLYLPQVHATVGTIATVDTNYFTEDANINIKGTGFTLTDTNVAFRLWDSVADVNYWSGRDFNIIDNNSLHVCDENVFALFRPDLNLGSSGLTGGIGDTGLGDYNGAYVMVGGSGCVGTSGSGKFDINAQIPFNVTHGLVRIYAHTFTAPTTISTTSFSTALSVYITPYLRILGVADATWPTRALNRITRARAPEDRNIMIQGIGFPRDSNVSFKLVDKATINDTNITDDGNGIVYSVTGCGAGDVAFILCADFNVSLTTAVGDGNWVRVDSNFVPEPLTANGVNDFNGWGFWRNGPDGVSRTGGFDVNIYMPRSLTFLNTINIDYNINTTPRDINRFTQVNQKSKLVTGVDANFISTPTIVSANIPATMKALVSSTWVDVNRAFPDGNITNFQAVKFWIQSNDFNVVTNGADVNMLRGGEIKTYDGNILTGDGKAGILSTTGKLSEFYDADANITLLNARSAGAMPTIVKDNNGLGVRYVCPSRTCKNLDGSTLSNGGTDVYSTLTWNYNTTATDGNLFFSVNEFSTYLITNTTFNITSPNGGENIHQMNNLFGGDGNHAITFTFTDNNVTERQLYANIYYSDGNGTFQGLIVDDLNLFDGQLISCTDSDNNIATSNSCTYDWNLNGIAPGEYWIDMNVFEFDAANDINKWLADSSDTNFLVNAPQIRMTDPFITVEKSTMGVTTKDANILWQIDFNLFYPNDMNKLRDLNNLSIWFDYDTNRANGVDGNFVDGNALVRNNASAPGRFYSSSDLNIADYNASVGSAGDFNVQKDTVITFDVNMFSTEKLRAGDTNSIRGAWYVVIDTNYGTAYSPYKIFFNDKRPVSRITLPGTNAPSTTRYLTGTAARIDFNVTDADNFDYNKAEGNFMFADIYLDNDSNGANGFGTNIIEDLNLASGSGTSRICMQDYNAIDNNSALDSNCTRTFNSTTVTDGNYFIAIDLNEGSSVTGPGTRATDYNYSDFTIVIDNTAPTLAISNLTTNDSTPSISITATDIYGLNSVYVKIDGGAWVHNGIQTGYTFGTLGQGNHNYDVNIYDNARNNSTASATITITGSSGGGGSEGGAGGGAGSSGGGETGTPTENPITTVPSTTESINSVLADAGLPAETLTIVESAAELVAFNTTYSTSGNKTSVKTTITNNSPMILKDVKVVLNVPKNIAQTSDNLSSSQTFEVLNMDPIILYNIALMNPGTSANVDYSVNRKLGSSAFTNLMAPLIIAFTAVEVNACEGISCNDNNPCTSDSCSGGNCSNTALNNGVVCGTNMVCSSGNCVEKTTGTPIGGAAAQIPTPSAGIDSTMLAVGILIVIVIVGIVFWQSKKGKSKGL
ncbi:MAG: hypothetical protein Q7S21_01470 [archaeon]|nr:hypothetical protein [archaeon]